ncbi:hypothetical protein ACFRQM_47645 [Streptomyces sp. NPDC056831]|uniref:hypothetical protein n=1 Tax=Streptomyces sp. NPDC056831 TaxID=3345954 RepID=UPI0036C2812A
MGVLMLALTGEIIAFAADQNGPEPTVQEKALAVTKVTAEARKRGELEGVSLWKGRIAAGGFSRTSALPDEALCQQRWDYLGLGDVYGEANDYSFVAGCVQEPADRLMNG